MKSPGSTRTTDSPRASQSRHALTADLSAITTALGTDTGASSELKAAASTFVTDRTASLGACSRPTCTGVITARTQLVTDLNASVSSTAST